MRLTFRSCRDHSFKVIFRGAMNISSLTGREPEAFPHIGWQSHKPCASYVR